MNAPVFAQECELSREYKDARKRATSMVFGEDNDYKKCQISAYENEGWKAMSKCLSLGDGENVGGECAHLVGRGKYLNPPDLSHCEEFKFEPTVELTKNILEEIVIEENIQKCVACAKDVAIEIAFGMIEKEHPGYLKYKQSYVAKQVNEQWLVLRSDKQFQKEPQEYPRLFVSAVSCKIDRLIWSK